MIMRAGEQNYRQNEMVWGIGHVVSVLDSQEQLETWVVFCIYNFCCAECEINKITQVLDENIDQSLFMVVGRQVDDEHGLQ